LAALGLASRSGATLLLHSRSTTLVPEKLTTVHDELLRQFSNNLQAVAKPPIVMHTILHGFSSWLNPTEHGRVRSLTFGSLHAVDTLLASAFHDQFYTIGWYQGCLGQISTKWAQTIDLYINSSLNGEYWASVYIKQSWTFIRGIWRARNQFVHGVTAVEHANIIMQKLHDNMRQHYAAFHSSPSYLLPRHHYLFTSRTLEQ